MKKKGTRTRIWFSAYLVCTRPCTESSASPNNQPVSPKSYTHIKTQMRGSNITIPWREIPWLSAVPHICEHWELRQEHVKLEVNLGYTGRLYLEREGRGWNDGSEVKRMLFQRT